MSNQNTETQFVTLHGNAFYAKILGKPRMNYNKDGTEWTMDFVPDNNSVATMKKLGIKDRLKSKEGHPAGDDAEYIRIRRKGEKKDFPSGEIIKNTPVDVVDKFKKPWNENTLIGNGSEVFIKIAVSPQAKPGMKARVTLMGVLVKDLVPYEAAERDNWGDVEDEEGGAEMSEDNWKDLVDDE